MRPGVWNHYANPMVNKPPLQQFPMQPSPMQNVATPRQVQVDTNNIQEAQDDYYRSRQRAGFFLKCCLGLLAVTAILAAAILPPVLILTLKPTYAPDIITSTTTGTTTTVTCAVGLTLTPSSTCVNTMIDFNNCGTVGYVCSSNYTSCSGGVCSTAPPVMLPGAIPAPGFNSSTTSIDDATTVITLPLNITLYNYTTDTVTLTTNGVVCLGACSIDWVNGNLPTSSFGGPTVLGHWDDLYIATGTSQTVYYAITGTAPNRKTTFEFYESHFGAPTQYYHFQIIFDENQPNIVTCFYFDVFSGGGSATIGVQASSTGPSTTYSYNVAGMVSYNTTLVFDTNAGTVSG